MVAGYWRSAPLDSTLLFSTPVELLTSRCQQLRGIHLWSEMLLVPLQELHTVKRPEIQKAKASSCTHFNGLNVELCPGLVAELALVGCRRRASLRTLMDLVSLSSQRGFSAVRGRFLPVRHHLTARPHNPRLLFPNKPLYGDLIKDLWQNLRSFIFCIR